MVIWKPLPFHGGAQNPKMIVVHSMAENIDWPNGPKSAWDSLYDLKLSAHALVHPNGDITRCVPDALVAWHSKRYNQDSLGVEFLVPGIYTYPTWKERIKTPWLTDEQYEAGIALIRSWLLLFSGCEIVEHSHIDPSRKVDPGKGFPWDEFLNEVHEKC